MFFNRILRKGVTLTELLVVLAIIALLSSIVVPTYINRVEQAKMAVAKAEVEEIAKAQEIVGITYGLYVPLQILDNVPVSSGPADDFNNGDIGNLLTIDTSMPLSNQIGRQDILSLELSSNVNLKVKELRENWAGPFLNPKRVYTGNATEPYPLTVPEVYQDHPLDPWNRPYRMFSPVGIVGSSADSTNYDSNGFSDGVLRTQYDLFDRFAIVSFGRDGVFGSSSTDARNLDNIFYLFGAGETTYIPRF